MAELTITFENKTGEEHKGCVFYGYRQDGTQESSGVKPVPANTNYTFSVGDCSQFKEWRFVAAINYSDKPENLDVVLIDTGKRPVTKCTWTITGTKA